MRIDPPGGSDRLNNLLTPAWWRGHSSFNSSEDATVAHARSKTVDPSVSGIYHCISRCVRRAFLCGSAISDRKGWIHERLIFLSDVFAIDVCGLAILDNHFHTVLETHPELVAEWTDLEIVRRWFNVFPKSIHRWALNRARRDQELRKQITSDGTLPDDVAIQTVAGIPATIIMLRKRLSSLSWFMRCVKHHIACAANREDDCRGHFWEGRFKSIRILDRAALLSIMVYVDLNVIRAGLATTPEGSHHTSIQDRIHVQQYHDKRNGRRRKCPARARNLVRRSQRSNDGDCWLASPRRLLNMTQSEYFATVDLVGRHTLAGKKGSIPKELRPILERLQLEGSSWCEAMTRPQTFFGSVIGSPARCAAEALRRGVDRTVCALDIWAKPRQA